MVEDLQDRAENFIIRMPVTAFSTDQPTPTTTNGSIQFARRRSFEDYEPGGTNDRFREWTGAETNIFNAEAGLEEHIETYADELESNGIATTAPPPVRVFEDDGVVVVVNEITVLGEHNVAKLQLTFDVSLTDHIARYQGSIDLQGKHGAVAGVDQEKIDDAWEDVGRFLHNELEWMTARLPTIEGSAELASEEE